MSNLGSQLNQMIQARLAQQVESTNKLFREYTDTMRTAFNVHIKQVVRHIEGNILPQDFILPMEDWPTKNYGNIWMSPSEYGIDDHPYALPLKELSMWAKGQGLNPVIQYVDTKSMIMQFVDDNGNDGRGRKFKTPYIRI